MFIDAMCKWVLGAAGLAMTGCSLMPPPEVPPVVQIREVQVPVTVPVVTPIDAAGRQLLAWSDEMRAWSNDALVQEARRLGDGGSSPSNGMRLALVLGLTRNPGDLVRAQQVLDGVLRATAVIAPSSVAEAVASASSRPLTVPAPEDAPSPPPPPALDWQPWARWLQSRYQTERRMEEQIERQAVQLREGQRQQDQLREKLEALKNIERQLVAPRRAGPHEGKSR